MKRMQAKRYKAENCTSIVSSIEKCNRSEKHSKSLKEKSPLNLKRSKGLEFKK